ncbi:hypothetical protein DFH28DRAFT_1193824 [Melampsora americana]|nr:hypothetical protein DFH28DRAFT_1193824 [Melampsora americana]
MSTFNFSLPFCILVLTNLNLISLQQTPQSSQRWISPALMEPWVLTPQPPLNSPSFLDLACVDRDLDMASGHMLIVHRPICEMSNWDNLFGEDEMVGEDVQ